MQWRHPRDRCYVRRFWGEEHDRVGHLVHRRVGQGELPGALPIVMPGAMMTSLGTIWTAIA